MYTNKKIKWGVIGACGIAQRRTIPAILKARNSELIAIMDIIPTTELVKKYNIPYSYNNEDELLANKEIDAVYIATPVYLHCQQVIKAANAGKHILVEKCLAMNVSQAEKMQKVCDKNKVKITEGYMMKFHPLHQQVKKIIEQEIIGQTVLCRAQLTCWYPDIEGAWRQDLNKGGGGALIDMASHCYDLLSYFFGEIKEVFAFTNTLTFKYSVEDSATTLLYFQSGAHGVVDTFYNIPDAAAQGRLELYGNKGSILAEGTIGQANTGTMIAYLSDDAKKYDAQQEKTSLDVKKIEIKNETPDINIYTAEIEYLANCILENKEPELNTIDDGIKLMRVIKAAYKSAKTGKKVVIV